SWWVPPTCCARLSFFFQAEAGIRVRNVTGVQTCALPILSLSVLNEDKPDLDPGYRAMLQRAWGPVRVINAARKLHGEKWVKPLYDAIGTRFHPGGRSSERHQVLVEAVAAVGLPADLTRYE